MVSARKDSIFIALRKKWLSASAPLVFPPPLLHSFQKRVTLLLDNPSISKPSGALFRPLPISRWEILGEKLMSKSCPLSFLLPEKEAAWVSRCPNSLDYLRKNVKTALLWWFTLPLGCTWWMQGSCRRLRRATRAASFTFGSGSPHTISRSRWGTWHCSSSSPRPSGPRLPRADTALRRIPAWGSSSNWVIPGTAAARAGPRGPAW